MALDSYQQDRELLEGRVALLRSDVERLTRERDLAIQGMEALRSQVGLQPSG